MLPLIFYFNPCFNGFTILTALVYANRVDQLYVSILVLMDSLFLLISNIYIKAFTLCLNPCFNGFTILTEILIFINYHFLSCLNPYFNGFTILTALEFAKDGVEGLGLNPYFNGFTILTSYHSCWSSTTHCGLNPYFNGFTILTRTFEKTLYLSMLQEFFQTLKSYFFD